MKDNKVILGVVPVTRDMFPPEPGIVTRDEILNKINDMVGRQVDVEIVGIEDICENGMLWDNDDVQKIADKFYNSRVDALFFPHCNFGQEEPVAMLAKKMGKPVLLWGPRDPAPVEEEFRVYDTQCGLFATAKALSRYNVPFTYIENCTLDAPVLERCFDKFIRVSAVVKAMQNMRVGQIGIRPRQFLSVKINESELLEKFGIEVTSIWTEEIDLIVKKLKTGNAHLIGAVKKVELPMTAAMLNMKQNEPDPRIKERMDDIKSKIDCSDTSDEKLENIACVEIAIEELVKLNNLDAISFECWAYMANTYGIRACFMLGDLIDRGIVAACETDTHAAISARLLQAAARGQSCPFVADITIRHPTNDNAELLWHCGPFPASLRKESAKAKMVDEKGYYEIKGGRITLARMDQIGGQYSLFADEVDGTDGPVTNGNYVWVETKDWPTWEKKFIYGPYIHHICGVHGNYADVMKEACKYINNLEHDSVEKISYE